jgi:hypothetical protein
MLGSANIALTIRIRGTALLLRQRERPISASAGFQRWFSRDAPCIRTCPAGYFTASKFRLICRPSSLCRCGR